MKIEELHQLYLNSKGICTDTRAIEKDSIFFALKGGNFDGNKFANKALDSGCKFAVVDDSSVAGNGLIHVDDTLKTLQRLAHYHRNYMSAEVIGITGSNGKTTTKELLTIVLDTSFKVWATPGNFNNHIGLPLTVLSAPSDTEVLILEMGDNKTGDIAELCEIAEPDYGYITNVGKDHLAGYEEGFTGNVKAKGELFDYIRANNKIAFVNTQDEVVLPLAKDIQKQITFGNKGDHTFLKLNAMDPFISYINHSGEICKTQLVGKYNLANIEAVYCIASYFKVDEKLIEKAISTYIPENNRSQLVKTDLNEILMDAYNANPSSVELALTSLSDLDANNKVSILGDMFELGDESQDEHQNIINLTETLNLNTTIFIGETYSNCTTKESHLFKDKAEFEKWIESNPIKNATILLKGSRGMKMETLKDCL
tara:strand:+ start:584 stop:1861 length:1278 start_codon:yes stop_codon:yes gene_type:complete